MNSTSQLFATINEELIAENASFSVELVDQYGSVFYNQDNVFNGSPFEHDYSKLVPREVSKIMDLPRFYEVSRDLIAEAQDREGIEVAKRVQAVEWFPEGDFSRFGDELITYKLISRKPGSMDPKGNGKPHRGNIIFDDLRSEGLPTKVLTIQCRVVDCVIEFSCYSSNSQTATNRALWLDKLFTAHKWAFLAQGVAFIHWEGQLSDNYLVTGSQKIYERPQRFLVRLIDPVVKADFMIRHITFKAELA